MVKPEWGVKRTCNSCGVRFYDLNNMPPVCPKCNTPYEMLTSSRRKRGAAAERGKQVVIDDLVLTDALDLPDDVDAEVAADLIEDTDDLDGDLDDVADVLDRGDDEDR